MMSVRSISLFLFILLTYGLVACGEVTDAPLDHQDQVLDVDSDQEALRKAEGSLGPDRSPQKERYACDEVTPIDAEEDPDSTEAGDSLREGERPAELAPCVSGNCVCDSLNALIQCRSKVACGRTATVEFLSGNTCSKDRCRNNAGCGGRTICKKGNQTCATLADDSGVCMIRR